MAGAIPVDRPLAVYTLIAVNVAVYLWTAVQAGSVGENQDAPLFEAWSMVPMFLADGQWWRLFTAGFLHFGPLHLAVNMWSLWVIGKDLERVLARVRFLGVYLLSLLGGSVAVYVCSLVGFYSEWNSQTAGASGAVFGLMGGLAVVLHRLRLSLRPALIMIVLNLVFSFSVPGISVPGHVGGLLTGAVLTALLVYRRRTPSW